MIRLFGTPCSLIGTVLEMPDTTDSENDASLEVQHVQNYEEFAIINNRIQCYNEKLRFEDAIVKQIATKHQKTREVMRMTLLSLS